MINKSIKLKEESKNKKISLIFLQSALIIPCITVFLYLLGWFYYQSFFNRLSLHHSFINFPITEYLIKSFPPAIITIIFGYISFKDISKPPKTFLKALRGNLFAIYLFGIGILPFFSYHPSNILISMILIIFVFMELNLIIIGPLRHRSIGYFWYKRKNDERIFIILMTILIIIGFSIAIGHYSGTELIKGNFSNEIYFIYKDESYEITKKPLILVLYNNGKYFVVEKDEKAPDKPNLYIIPDEQVKMATFNKIN